MKFKPETLGFRILIKPEVLPKKSEGGIDLSALDDRGQAVNSDKGEIIAIGPEAFKAYGFASPYKVGDKVFYAKYGAKALKDKTTGDLYMICNDEDILVGYSDE